MIFSPCISMLFGKSDLSFTDQIREVHRLGYSTYEFWQWNEIDVDQTEAVQKETGLEAAAFLATPEQVPLVVSGERGKFIEGVKQAIPLARRLGCRNLLTLTGGWPFEQIARRAQYESVVEGLKTVAPHLEEAGVTCVLEPLNQLVDHPGYFLNSSAEAFAIVEEVGSPNVKVLFDIYHQQITEGNLIPNITGHIDLIGHFHVGDHPGRKDPGTGEINYHNVLRTIKDAGYEGIVGLEFQPVQDPETSLTEFMQEYGYLIK